MEDGEESMDGDVTPLRLDLPSVVDDDETIDENPNDREEVVREPFPASFERV